MSKFLEIASAYLIKDLEWRNKKLKEIELKYCKLIMVLLCKNEVDIIEKWINFHKFMGVDGFIVTDNNSNDGTRDILEKYKNKGWILEIIDEPEKTYYQREWCDRMIKLSKNKYNADWVISSDADEFWYSNKLNLKKDILSNEGASLLFLPMINFIPYLNSENFFSEPSFIGRLLNEFELKKYNIDSPLYSTHHVSYKIILKASDYKRISFGNHDSAMKNKRVAYISNIRLYHYFIRNFDHFNKKVKKGGEAISQYSDRGTATHWRAWYEDYYLNNKMKDAWDQFFLFDKFKLLCDIGVIVKDPCITDFLEHINLANKV